MRPADVDAYLRDGCGRCAKYRTPECKVHRFEDVLAGLREIALASGLREEIKWGCPCYTLDGKNVAMVAAFVDRAALQLFRGAELDDPAGVLEAPGPSSRFVRLLVVRSAAKLRRLRPIAARLLAQAIALERRPTRAAPAPASEPVPPELARALAADPRLGRAWDALTPGRRRSHVLHVAGAKQEATRERRVAACVHAILAGRGFHER